MLQLFFQNNQGGADTTVLEYIGFIGSPLDSTNMEEFKRVSSITLKHLLQTLQFPNGIQFHLQTSLARESFELTSPLLFYFDCAEKCLFFISAHY